MQFVPRTTAPDASNPYYLVPPYGNNPCILGKSSGRIYAYCVLPNCTGYAHGRWKECQGFTSSNLSTGNANSYFGHSDGYTRGQTPKLGSIICWDGTNGHVGVVEEIYNDNYIKWSESNWNGTISNGRYFRMMTGNPATLYSNYGLTFQGYIYPVVSFDNDTPVVTEWIKGNRYLSMSEMENNAVIVYRYLNQRGWTLNAVAGLLGNLKRESTVNPAIWEGLDYGNYNVGYGLVGWTPATNYTDWATANGYDITDGNKQLQWIDEETVPKGQWISTSAYPLSFADFKISTNSPEDLASAFLYNFERAGVPAEQERREAARHFYNYLLGIDPGGEPPDDTGGEGLELKGRGLIYYGRPYWKIV